MLKKLSMIWQGHRYILGEAQRVDRGRERASMWSAGLPKDVPWSSATRCSKHKASIEDCGASAFCGAVTAARDTGEDGAEGEGRGGPVRAEDGEHEGEWVGEREPGDEEGDPEMPQS